MEWDPIAVKGEDQKGKRIDARFLLHIAESVDRGTDRG